jgi:DNA-binding LytR/AlgR family response regulator
VTVLVRIAICDDEKEAVTLHEEIIKDSLQSCGIGYEITTYTYSSNLLSDITEDGFFYDLLLLDIEMPDVTGMELAGKIKPFLPNIKVIFITSHMEYAIDAFELSIFRYVPKNDLEKRMKTAVADAAKLIELEAGKEYIIQTAGRMEKIPYRDIFYIQRDGGKNSAIHSNVGASKVRKSLQQVYEELAAPEFIFIDRGCIVNIIQIMKVADGMASLKNGETLPISRSHLQTVKQQINRFWGTHI